MTQRRAAVLGSPIAHSLSPVLHRAAYDVLGLDWRYDAYDVTEDDLPRFLAESGDEWAGLSLTMPLKRAVLPLLDWTSAGAAAVEAVNTVVLARGRRLGTNTDVPGMSAALAERGVTRFRTASILGGGATAASALAAVALAGVTEPGVVVRRPSSADALWTIAGRLGQKLRVHAWADAPAALDAQVVVQTTPAGAADALASAVPEHPGVLFDVVYDPWPTPLAAAWAAAGGVVVNGLDLLVHQAVLQVRLMTGIDVQTEALVDRLREAGLLELASRGGDA